jgi:hypothetical protein
MLLQARKTMNHQSLAAECISQLHFFKPNPKVRPLFRYTC